MLENLLIGLEQRNFYMRRFLDITKQLEVKVQQPEIDFQDLLEKRQECIERIEKCNALIATQLEALPSENSKVIKQILNQEKVLNVIPIAYEIIVNFTTEYVELIDRTRPLDKNVNELLLERHSSLKQTLNNIRKQKTL